MSVEILSFLWGIWRLFLLLLLLLTAAAPQPFYFLWPAVARAFGLPRPPVKLTIPLFWVSHKATDVIREDDDYSYITESN